MTEKEDVPGMGIEPMATRLKVARCTAELTGMHMLRVSHASAVFEVSAQTPCI